MTESNKAQRAREWLERQLEELAQLRNASRRDPSFKTWRQNTLTVLQRIWPDDPPRIDRFRRIPFSPPMAKASEKQTREYFGRGWGEAGVFLRSLISEVTLMGVQNSGELAEESVSDSAPALDPDVLPEQPAEVAPAKVRAAEPADAELAADAELHADEIGRAMAKFMSTSPVFRRMAAAPAPGAPASEPAASVVDLTLLATEIDTLGLPPEDVPVAREALLALARAAQWGLPDWDLVRDALQQSAASPALARRALPLLMGFVDKAA